PRGTDPPLPPGAHARRGRSAPLPADDVLPSAARVPAPVLADRLGRRRGRGGDRQLVRGSDRRAVPTRPAPVPGGVHPLHEPGVRVPLPGRRPVPGLRRARSGLARDRGGRRPDPTAAPRHAVPRDPHRPRAPALDGARLRPPPRRGRRMVRRAAPGAHAVGPARARREPDPLRRSGAGVRAGGDGSLPELEPDPPQRAAAVSRAERAIIVAVLAVLWTACAVTLWRSSTVPGNLHLPSVDVRSLFTPAELARAARFERFLRIEFVLSQLALIGALVFWAWRGPGYTRESAAGRIGTGMLLGMLGLAVAWMSQLPFTVAEVWWERRYGLLRTGYLDAIFGDWWGLGGEFLAISLTLLIVM